MKRYIRSSTSANQDILKQYQKKYPELDITVDDSGIEVYNKANDTSCSMDFYVTLDQMPTEEFEKILWQCVETVED